MSEADVLRLRFAVSPLWEVLAAVRVLSRGPVPAALRPWAKGVCLPPDVELLVAIQSAGPYVPDFLTPPPAAGERSLDAELALVAATPLPVVHDELARALSVRPERDRALERAVASPAAARDEIVLQLRRAWEALVRPSWPRLHRVLATDVDHRSRRLVVGGIAALLEDLHPTVSWSAGSLRVQGRVSETRDLAGEGVVLLPSLFHRGQPLAILDPPYQPTLVYQARGIATAFTHGVAPADALVRLLGKGRADLLAQLDEPAGTSSLAVALGRSPGTISEHLHALRFAGLAEVRRTGKQSRWSRTALGDALVAGPLSS